MKEKCKRCPFREPANGVCYFPGNCDEPADAQILKLFPLREDDSAEEAQKEIRTL